MVKRCVNPECPNEFRQMHTGDLYALDCGMADTVFVWLCADCAPKLAVTVDATGIPSVRRKTAVSTAWTVPASHDFRLRHISGCRQAAPFHRTGSSGGSEIGGQTASLAGLGEPL